MGAELQRQRRGVAPGLVACISTKISQMSPSGLLLERHSDVEKSFHKHQDVDEQREGEDGRGVAELRGAETAERGGRRAAEETTRKSLPS